VWGRGLKSLRKAQKKNEGVETDHWETKKLAWGREGSQAGGLANCFWGDPSRETNWLGRDRTGPCRCKVACYGTSAAEEIKESIGEQNGAKNAEDHINVTGARE